MKITICLISKIIGSSIWFAFGVLFFRAGQPHKKKEEKNYSQYPTALGTYVSEYQTHNKTRKSVISFVDAEGVERLGFHDWGLHASFPQRNSTNEVYYWKRTDNSRYSLNSQSIDYMVHYCNRHLYDEYLEKIQKPTPLLLGIGAVLMVIGVCILLFGNG